MLTTAEIAAWLGVTPSAIRQMVRRKGIQPIGRLRKAYLYDATEILRHTGNKDRLAS